MSFQESPFSKTARTEPHDHLVRFYADDDALFQAVGRHLHEGLEAGEPLLVIAVERHRTGFRSALEALRRPSAAANGEHLPLVELDAEETLRELMVGDFACGLPDRSSFRRVIGGAIDRTRAMGRAPRVRAYGEMVEVLVRHGNEAGALKLEELWNELSETHSFFLCCAYSMDLFDRARHGNAFAGICRLHSRVYPAGTPDDLDTDGVSRRIAELEQRSKALESEINVRSAVESTLREREQQLIDLSRALEEDRRRLSEADRRKDEFFAVLSHELRNPLAPIVTALEIMDLRGDEHSRPEREVIRRQARHLAGLVEDLLDISRVTGGKVALRRERVEIASIVANAIEMASPLLEERGHALHVHVPREGLLVDADPIRMRQVVTNLLINAAKYSPPGGRIAVAAAREDDAVVLTVEDDGIGMTRDAIPGLFEPFVQGARASDRSQGGLGLGLALVRSFVHLHGGTVAANSEGPGRGSRFAVRLPVATPPAAPLSRENGGAGVIAGHAGTHNGSGRPDGNGNVRPNGNGNVRPDGNGNARPDGKGNGREGPRVLVVDDNRDGALTLSEVLRLLGYEVRVASDGPSALIVAAEFLPDVAIIDIGLPVMDGYELARLLRQNERLRSLKIIAITGYGREIDRERSAQAGVDVHAVKPVDLETLRCLLPASSRI